MTYKIKKQNKNNLDVNFYVIFPLALALSSA